MDQKCFDAIAREMGNGSSRRQALGALAAAGIGGALALVGFGSAEAACTHVRKPCKSGGECCGKKGTTSCDRISKSCTNNRLRRKNRCCRTNGSKCDRTCDCCDPLVCVQNTCVRPQDATSAADIT
jgi:hypothetical protein